MYKFYSFEGALKHGYCGETGVTSDANGLKRLNDIFNGQDANTLEGILAGLTRKDAETGFVAQVADDSVGFLCAQMLKSICYNVFYVEITELFVEEVFRGAGVGRALMQAAEIHFREMGIHDFQLFTGRDNLNPSSFMNMSATNDMVMFSIGSETAGK